MGVACLAVSLVAVTCWTVPFAADLDGTRSMPWNIAGGIAWLAQLALLAWIGLRARFSLGRTTLMLSLALFLVAPIVAFATASAIAEAFLFLVAYFLNVRVVARGWPMPFALLVIGGVLVFAGVVLEDVEDRAPDSSIATFGDAVVWGLGQVFRFQSLVDVRPVTPVGQFVGAVVIALSVVFAATLLTAIAAWSFGERQKQVSAHEEARWERAVRRAVRSALEQALGPDAVRPAAEDVATRVDPSRERRVWLDLDRIAGSRPGALWMDRSVAIDTLVRDIEERPDRDAWRHLVGPDLRPRFIGLRDGAAGPAEASAPRDGSLVLLDIPDASVEDILARAEPGDLLVSSGSEAREKAQACDITLVSPADFLRGLS